MTNEEAIKLLLESKDNSIQMSLREWEEWDKRYFEAIDIAIEALKQTAWIPCEERLPEPYDDVIISAKGYVCEANLRESKEYFLTHNARLFIRTEEVDAWMPLPKPYEGRTE